LIDPNKYTSRVHIPQLAFAENLNAPCSLGWLVKKCCFDNKKEQQTFFLSKVSLKVLK